MCEFVSFGIGIKEKNKGKIYFGGTFESNEGIELANGNNLKPEEYRGCEWTENGLSVRVHGEESESEFKAIILGKYVDRASFIKNLPKKLIGYYTNGNKEYECNYEDGKRHGKSISYYENGKKSHEWSQKDGKLYGKLVYWYANGNKRTEFNYGDGKRHGKSIKLL